MNNKLIKNLLNLTIVIIATLSIGVVIYAQQQEIIRKYNQKIAMLISEANVQYPELDQSRLIEILNNNEYNTDINFLEYGIDINRDSLVDGLNNNFYYIMILVIIMLVMTCIIYAINKVFLMKDKQQIRNILDYVEHYQEKLSDLKVLEHSDEDISLLQSEIFKLLNLLDEESARTKESFVLLSDALSDISHQLKTKLTSINLMIEIVLNPQSSIVDVNFFKKEIKKEVNNTNFLVNGLLTLSKFDASSIMLNRTEVLVTDIIYQALQNVSMIADLNNVTFTVSNVEHLVIKCDFEWQVEALTNIVKNAVEHSYEYSAVNISVEDYSLYIAIKITNNGIGISEEDLPFVFDRYYQGNNHKKDSVGIGLALSRKIIENDNGIVSVDSVLNQETTFIIKYFR